MSPRRTRSKARETKEDQGQGVLVRAVWKNAERIPILFANQTFIRSQDDEFLLTFGQVELPYEVEISEETKERLKNEGLPVQVVARLGIPARTIEALIEQLTKVHSAWRARQQRGESS